MAFKEMVILVWRWTLILQVMSGEVDLVFLSFLDI